MSEAKLTEISVSHSVGGKVSIIKYNEDSNYFVSMSQKFEIPEDWAEEDALAFQVQKQDELREIVDALGQVERDERFDQSFMAE